MTKLTFFFSGTDMTWEDTALFLELGARKRHNLREEGAKHYYYFFDGPGASSSPEHNPVDYLEFDETKADFTTSKPRKNYSLLEHIYDVGHGKGMDHTIRVAFKIIELAIKKGITEFDFVGFSRGGSMALAEGALIKKLENANLSKELLDKIKVNIIAIDPVAGLSRNRSANSYGELSPLVKTCIVGLATNESLPGFEPRNVLANIDAYNIKFNKSTQYVFLPFPEDHLMTNLWMQDIVRRYIPAESELLSTCNETFLIERRLGLGQLKWYDSFGQTAAYRMVRYVEDKKSDEKHSPKYTRHVLPTDEKNSINLHQGIEEFFKHLPTQHSPINIGHTSLQNDADSEVKNRIYRRPNGEIIKIGHAHPEFKQFQMFFAKYYDRAVKKNLHCYTNRIFVNLLHEAMFQRVYPNLHKLLLNWDINDLAAAMHEFESIELPVTKENIRNALIKGVQIKSIESFGSTNIKNLNEIFKIITHDSDLEAKVNDKKADSVSIADNPNYVEICCFANIAIKADAATAEAVINKYKSKYLPDFDSWQILYQIYQENHKELPKGVDYSVRSGSYIF